MHAQTDDKLGVLVGRLCVVRSASSRSRLRCTALSAAQTREEAKPRARWLWLARRHSGGWKMYYFRGCVAVRFYVPCAGGGGRMVWEFVRDSAHSSDAFFLGRRAIRGLWQGLVWCCVFRVLVRHAQHKKLTSTLARNHLLVVVRR